MNFKNVIYSNMHDILNKYKNEELPRQYEEIKNERKEINKKIQNIIKNEPSLLKHCSIKLPIEPIALFILIFPSGGANS
jgi:hypothetical protein